jgi:proline dehydrogenase
MTSTGAVLTGEASDTGAYDTAGLRYWLHRLGKPNLIHRAVMGTLTAVPAAVVERFARDYVAGPRLADALRVADELTRTGRLVSFDVLGEGYDTPEKTRALADQYVATLDAETTATAAPTLSVMMTGLGLLIDPELCHENLTRVAREARSRGCDLTINMEDSSTTTATLEAYRRLRREGFDNVGIVLQAALRRTPADVADLADLAPRVRIVKGIWVEPFAVAHDDPDVIRASYLRIVERVVDAGGYVEIATHDDWLIAESLERLRQRGLEPSGYEFQVLLGVRPELADLLVADAQRVRVYVPFGEDWYEYCMRRFRENPAFARQVIRASTRRIARAGKRPFGRR